METFKQDQGDQSYELKRSSIKDDSSIKLKSLSIDKITRKPKYNGKKKNSTQMINNYSNYRVTKSLNFNIFSESHNNSNENIYSSTSNGHDNESGNNTNAQGNLNQEKDLISSESFMKSDFKNDSNCNKTFTFLQGSKPPSDMKNKTTNNKYTLRKKGYLQGMYFHPNFQLFAIPKVTLKKSSFGFFNNNNAHKSPRSKCFEEEQFTNVSEQYDSNKNINTANFNNHDLLINAFKFYLRRRFAYFNTRKMIDEFSEKEKQDMYKSSDTSNSSANEIFNLFRNKNLNNHLIENANSEKSKEKSKENPKCKDSNLIKGKSTRTINNTKTTKTLNNSSTKLSTIQELIVKTNAFSVPHIKKIHKGGEDALKFDDNILIIADGVGGWNTKGIDPSMFSKTLVNEVHLSFSEVGKNLFCDGNLEKSIRKCLQRAIDKTLHLEGSSTISLIAFDSIEKRAFSAYIGDSLYLITRFNFETREYEMVYVSKEQSHGFNLPFQVGKQCDSAATAKITEHDLNNKDIIILATDGLWDNLSLEIIISTINQVKNSTTQDVDTKLLSELLVKKAQVVSYNK